MSVAQPAGTMAKAPPTPRHIVDVLIEERAPRLAALPFWPLIRPALYALLDYGKARRMADAIAPMPGQQALDFVSRLLSLKVRIRGLERVPPKGRLVVIVNHPTGVGDGIAVYDALKGRRPDLIFFVNADAFRICPRFDEVMIPVEWVEAKRTREKTRTTLIRAREALEAERAVAIFPAGRLARWRGGRLKDPPWAPSAISLARKHHAPVLPIHLTGPRSSLFHFFDKFSEELRDITLFHELLNKRGDEFDLTIGPLISPDALEGEAVEHVEALKAYVEETLPAHPDQAFP
jgi:putative hemolysin